MKKGVCILFAGLILLSICGRCLAVDIPVDISDDRIVELQSQQIYAQEMAYNARKLGCEENGVILSYARTKWWEAEYQIQEIEYWKRQKDAEMIAVTIYNEALGGCTTRHRELVAAVIVNRVLDSRFPNTISEVLAQPGQYHIGYTDESSVYYQNAISDPENFNMCLKIANKALDKEIECPTNVLYQSNFASLGSGYYEICYTSYSTTYFAYG